MAFLDRITIHVEAGSGGNGRVSFRREKSAPKGGPDGGDGGRGGDVVLHTTTSVQDFSHLAGIPLFNAQSGEPGGKAKCSGKNGQDLVLPVPPGTVVRDVEKQIVLKDLSDLDADLVVAFGGKGGKGNVHFASAINQVPQISEPGEDGEIRILELELKLIADVGLVGLPNAGKSTLLSKISEARPKIAAYPFTTLYPQLGVTDVNVFGRMVVADIPGLIEGAHKGIGLGDEFLRHIERTEAIVHVIDAASADPVADYKTLRAELAAYGRGIPEKHSIVVANKMDLPEAKEGLKRLKKEVSKGVIPVSAVTGEGLDKFLKELRKLGSKEGK